jgi:hypothetical protein
MLRGFLLMVATLAAGSCLAAEPIDLSKPYGTKSGCDNKDGQQYYADDMLLLTDTGFVTAVAACEFNSKTVEADGSITVDAVCEAEGETDQAGTKFTISRSKAHEGKLVIADDAGNVLVGEIGPCP